MFDPNRDLHDVLAEVIDATHRYPSLRRQIFHCLFDEWGLREGGYHLDTEVTNHEAADGRELCVLAHSLRPSVWLLRFAHAVAQGVLPEGPLLQRREEISSDEGHGFSRSREDLEVNVQSRAIPRIPHAMNTE